MVNPDQILKELSKLWVDLAHEQQHGDAEPGAGVLRACAMTLITIVDESEDPTNVGETVALLMREHPSRSVVIRLRDCAEKILESRVFAQCWMPFGQRRQICCEQIEIVASTSSLDEVPAVVLPLTVPDLPVILWCRSPRLFETSAFPAVAAMSDKVIVDTGAFSDPAKALDVVVSAGKLRRVADLSWARITGWRETISQVFVNQGCVDSLPRFTSTIVQYSTPTARPEDFYLAAWLQSGLIRAGSTTRVELRHGDVASVTFTGGAACTITLQSDGSGNIDVAAAGFSSHSAFPQSTDYTTLREELGIMSRDTVFEAALEGARELVA